MRKKTNIQQLLISYRFGKTNKYGFLMCKNLADHLKWQWIRNQNKYQDPYWGFGLKSNVISHLQKHQDREWALGPQNRDQE